jgi:hypothetical protein
MSNIDFDTDPLLNPPKEPSANWCRVIDFLSWTLPVCAAVLSVGSGIATLQGIDKVGAILGIFGGIAGAGGVIFTGWASRIRDGRLAVTHALASLGFDIAQGTQSELPPGS